VFNIQDGKLLLADVLDSARNGLLSAVEGVFLIAAVVMATSFILNMLLVDERMPKAFDESSLAS
jgi:hypothetical protein